MKAIKTNLEPFIDWVSYTLRFNDCTFDYFSRHLQLYNPEILNSGRLGFDNVNLIDRNEYLKLEFTGKFFTKKTAKDNIKEIDQWLKYFFNKFKVHNFFDKGTISRIDLSANDYINTFSNKFLIHTKRKQELTHFYRDNNILKGIGIGKRGKNFVYYKCYDKREDTKSAKEHASLRFGTYLFLRHEYELGRKFIREKNIGFEKTNFKELFSHLFATKRVDFNYDNSGNKKIFCNVARKKADKDHLIRQVLGIIRNNLMDEKGRVIEKIKAL